MAEKKYRVKHPSLYLSVGGKLQEMDLNSEVVMEEKHAEKHVKSGKLELATAKPAKKVSQDDGKD